MHVWSEIGGAVCVAISVIGLVLSWRTWRKRGATRGMRAVAWSLLPLAAYLTHSVGLIGRVVNAFVLFAGSFVFSTKSWAGVAVAALAAVLFVISGGLPLLNWRKARERRKAAGDGKADGSKSPAAAVSGGQAGKSVSKASEPADDDLSDVQEILRRRGIN
jgi:hypothetical protein